MENKKEDKIRICVLCSKEIADSGNPATEIKEGRCCDTCYKTKVVKEIASRGVNRYLEKLRV